VFTDTVQHWDDSKQIQHVETVEKKKPPRPVLMYYTGKRVMKFAENNSVVPPRPAPRSPERSKLGCRFASKALQYAAEL